MGTLPRPELPPGPHRDLVDALHDLHHRAGWPSLRNLARGSGVSHTTVSHVFSSPRLPTWGTLELLVESLGGDTGTFHDLWLAASSPQPAAGESAQLAGRHRELAVVRHHLETGTGLLLVTGEAGMGKTRLVTAAARTTDCVVAVGHCLPLSTQVPLLPVADALRDVHDHDGGAWLYDALSRTPPWVAEALGALLPGTDALRSDVLDSGSMQRLLGAAVRTVLTELAARRPLAILLEDLHWADTSTLELLEQLVTRPTLPLLGTWRSDDPDVAGFHAEWHTRVRRSSTVRTLRLSALTEAETATQLALLTNRTPDPATVRSIHARSLGLPLFTEQLAAAVSASEDALPDLLVDLLDARLGLLHGATWASARALAIADRSVPSDVLRAASGLEHEELVGALHELTNRQLLASPSGDEVMLKHPLLAEAIRRRVVPGESQTQHSALARALAAAARAEPAEIARHWAEAGDADEELPWRIRAARAAGARFALRHELDQWMRVLELWPAGVAEAGDPPIRHVDVFVSALDLMGALGPEPAERLNRDALALVPQLAPLDAAAVLLRVGDFHSAYLGQHERGIELMRRAVDAYQRAAPSEGLVRAFGTMKFAYERLGRDDDAEETIARGLEVARAVGHPGWQRTMLAHHAWIRAQQGDTDRALSMARKAARVPVAGPDPRGAAVLAALTTDILLMTAAAADEVIATGRRGLDAVEPWGLDLYVVAVIRFNMTLAMRRAGRVGRAFDFIEQSSLGDALSQDLLGVERALLHTLRGETEVGSALARQLEEVPWRGIDDRSDVEEQLTDVALWTGRPGKAFRRAMEVVDLVAPTQASRRLGPLLARAARAAADRGDLGAHASLTSALSRCANDPFATHGVPVAHRPWGPTWTAEMSRLTGTDTTDHWLFAASTWDAIARPHESSYCRWRAAAVATRDSRGTVAARLLDRAARDAHEHAPLSQAIAAARGLA